MTDERRNILALADLREQFEKRHARLESRIITLERGLREARAQVKQTSNDERMFLRELEGELRQALRPVIAEIASLRAQLAAINQRNEIGRPPELPEAIRAALASRRQ